jgi:hypothetical protein
VLVRTAPGCPQPHVATKRPAPKMTPFATSGVSLQHCICVHLPPISYEHVPVP